LALSAYDAGPARIDRALRKAKHRNYWKLHLNSETKNHVPKIMAVLAIHKDPIFFGFPLEVVDTKDMAFHFKKS
jgi:hypothetical protein